MCPTLCSGHGEYQGGQCICHKGWKGKECELRQLECPVADCSGHGHCREGVCQCSKGFTGEACEIGKLSIIKIGKLMSYILNLHLNLSKYWLKLT